jgi:predicted HicB family RNase H-like nuclease
MKRKPGRPKGSTDPAAKRAVLQIRVEESTFAGWKASAKAAGQTLSRWVTEKLNS